MRKTAAKLTPSPTLSYKMSTRTNESIMYTKPFEQWRPLGGGSERDIFHYYKIFPVEEEAFLTFWAAKRPIGGYLSHDDNGTLVFRISSAHLPGLSAIGISGIDSLIPDVDAQWLQVCDGEGISWLTRFCFEDRERFPSELYDTAGRSLTANGRVGQFGPSGLSVHDFVKRQG